MIKETDINAVASNELGFAFRVGWFDDEKGVGNIDFMYSKQHGFTIESEAMSKDFIKTVLNSIVDNARIKD